MTTATTVFGHQDPWPAVLKSWPQVHNVILFVAFHLIYLIIPAAIALLPLRLVLTGNTYLRALGCVLPIAWISTFGAERRLGRPWKSFATLPLWSVFFSWFPVTLEKPTKTSFDKQYIFGVHPHGALAFNRGALGFAYDVLWNAAFPGLDFRVLTAAAAFKVPLIREMWLWTFCCDAGKATARRVLGAGKSIIVYPGGEREQLLTKRGEHILYLTKRKGFVKLALQTGVPLVPMYAFGETDLYTHHGLFLGLRQWLVQAFGVAVPLISGSCGLLPYKTPVAIVVGDPIPMPRPCGGGGGEGKEPTQADIDDYHAAYVKALTDLFETNKEAKGYKDAALVIV
ncbi:hypothetical protein CTAYLR_006986 [Chrysophaeum taylorii]|uniref:Acyltransferase n=1 Tax=Chrysophaeum taylorii TaxID=2483200 RepID=A0AAD7UA78_9STRA|nr:hypothetical protein CTAYLR_006986 [Chrysophaeum taylorii]